MSKEQFLKENLRDGEIYAGLILGENGAPDHHVFLLSWNPKERMKWSAAMKAAKKTGGSLPTRREQSLLFANAKAHFEATWYWSCEEYAPGSRYAWGQYFVNGSQNANDKDYAGRARAVRRLYI